MHLKSLLKSTLRGPWQVAMTTREETETGRALSDRFVDRLDISFWLAYGTLSPTQQRLLYLLYGPDDRTIQEAAGMVNLPRSTAYRLRHDALEYLIRVYYDEPGYCLPYRVYTRTQPNEGDLDD